MFRAPATLKKRGIQGLMVAAGAFCRIVLGFRRRQVPAKPPDVGPQLILALFQSGPVPATV